MIFPQKKEKKERKRKQTRRKWFAKCYLKAETLQNDESQRIRTTNILVKNQHGVQRQIQENQMQATPYNLNLVGKSKSVPLIGSLKQITKNKESRWGRSASITSRAARNID